MILYLDLETLAGTQPWLREELAKKIKAPGTLKKPESIAAWERDEKPAAVEEAVNMTALDGTYGSICCIGWAWGDDQPRTLVARTQDDEALMLDEWFAILRRDYSGTSGTKPVIVGHNVAEFDLPYLWKRCVINGVKPPFWWPRDPKPWSEAVADTMTMFAGARNKISMDRLCKVLGIPGKDGTNGADVAGMAERGEWDDIAAYCRADVERTRAIYKRLTFA